MENLSTGREVRAAIRSGFREPTAALAPEYVQANLVAVPAEYAAEFRSLCARNPVACPLLDGVTDGSKRKPTMHASFGATIWWLFSSDARSRSSTR